MLIILSLLSFIIGVGLLLGPGPGYRQPRSKNWFITFLGILFVILGVLALVGAGRR